MKPAHYLPLLCLALAACRPEAPVSLTWQHIANDLDGKNLCESRLTLTNTSRDTLFADWMLYWNQMSVEPVPSDTAQAVVTQLQASYHSFGPTRRWQPLAPGQTRTFFLRYKGNIMRRTAAPQGPFGIFRQGRPASVPIHYIYSSDGHEFRRHVPHYPYAGGGEMYRRNSRFADTEPLPADRINLLPVPKHIRYTGGTCRLDRAAEVYIPDSSLTAAEAYRLVITPDTGFLTGHRFYAGQTLRMLRENQPLCPCAEIDDRPDTPHRGFMLDIARNFTPKQEILRLIDVMALYKMNVLHLHLTDDEGWRLEIPGLPELTAVGSRRGYTADERDCLYPMYSGGWDPDERKASANGYLTRSDFIELLRYADRHAIRIVPEIDMPGHSRAAIKAMEARYYRYIGTDTAKAEEYLLSDFQDTSRYVSAQHYTDNVICIALPSCYTFAQKVIDEVAAMYSEAAVPLTLFHVGGDEVPRGAWSGSPKVAEYIASKAVETQKPGMPAASLQQVTAEDVANLKDSFLEAVVQMLAQYGIEAAGWEEVAFRRGQPNPRFAGKGVVTYAWNSVPEWRGDEKPYRLANAGYPVMICSVCNLYLDMCYVNHEEERGLNWGGYVDDYQAWELRPDSLYLSVKRTMRGEERDVRQYAQSDKVQLIPDSARNLRGVQAQLWSETVRNSDQLEEYIFPKLLATAARAWNFRSLTAQEAAETADEAALNRFNTQLWQYEIPRLHRMGIRFHLPQPGILREGDTIRMNCPYPEAAIRYTLDGSEPDAASPRYTGPFAADAPLINAKAFLYGQESNTTHSVPEE